WVVVFGQLRRGSAGRIVATPVSSTSTTKRPASFRRINLLRPAGRRAMIAWVSVRVSITKPSSTFWSRNAPRPALRVPPGSISPTDPSIARRRSKLDESRVELLFDPRVRGVGIEAAGRADLAREEPACSQVEIALARRKLRGVLPRLQRPLATSPVAD